MTIRTRVNVWRGHVAARRQADDTPPEVLALGKRLDAALLALHVERGKRMALENELARLRAGLGLDVELERIRAYAETHFADKRLRADVEALIAFEDTLRGSAG